MKTDKHGYIIYESKVWFIQNQIPGQIYKAQTNGTGCYQDRFEGIAHDVCKDDVHQYFTEDWWYHNCYREGGFCNDVDFNKIDSITKPLLDAIPQWESDKMGFDAWLNSESYQSAAKAYDDKEYELITGLSGWITWEEFVPKFEKVLNDHNKNERLKNFKIKDFCYESKVLVEAELDGEPVDGVITWMNCD